jgi:hypothetical protein
MKYVLLASILAFAVQGAELNARVPVLAELFTSEGCSSCPPADALLMKLDQMQPVAGAQIIVLSEHVDYWNSLGWKDPYSSAQFTQRQGMYGRSLVVDPYTPQLVIDGRAEVSAHDEKAIDAAVLKAAARPKTAVKIVEAKREDKEATVAIQIGALGSGKGDVWVAIADDRDQSSVRNGENKGRTLNHVAVVRSLGKVGAVTKSAGLEKTVRIPLAVQTDGMRVVVFVAESGGPVLGAAMRELQ